MRVAVAGGTSSVGQEVISRLTNDGHEVLSFGSTKPENSVEWFQVNFDDPAAIASSVDSVEGSFDALVCAVDISPRKGQAPEILVKQFLATRRFLERMAERLSPGAVLLTISSRAGWNWKEHFEQVQELMKLSTASEVETFVRNQGIDELRAYALASEALIAWTAVNTEDFIRRGIRANTISPAAVENEFFDDITELLGSQALKNVSRAGRVGKPSEVADVVRWMISPASSWIKGQDIIVDGGIGAIITSEKLMTDPRSNPRQSVVEIATSPSVIRRSARIAVVVGLVLAALNHGDRILASDIDANMLLKICLTFLVPFCVSTYSSVLAVRSNMQKIEPPI